MPSNSKRPGVLLDEAATRLPEMVVAEVLQLDLARLDLRLPDLELVELRVGGGADQYADKHVGDTAARRAAIRSSASPSICNMDAADRPKHTSASFHPHDDPSAGIFSPVTEPTLRPLAIFRLTYKVRNFSFDWR